MSQTLNSDNNKNSPLVTPTEIIKGINAGNKKFESLLVKKYFNGLLFVLNKHANNVDLAADIAQETFIIVIQKARNDQIDKPESLKAFIRQVGINLLLAFYRKESRQATSTEEHIDLTVADNVIEHYKILHDQKLLNQVTKFLRELPTERDREILQNYFVYDKSKDQICMDLNIESVHFDRVLYRSRNRLKQIMQKHFPELNKTSKENIATLLTVMLSVGIILFMQNDFKKVKNSMREMMPSQHYIETNIHLTRDIAYSHSPLLSLQANV